MVAEIRTFVSTATRIGCSSTGCQRCRAALPRKRRASRMSSSMEPGPTWIAPSQRKKAGSSFEIFFRRTFATVLPTGGVVTVRDRCIDSL